MKTSAFILSVGLLCNSLTVIAAAPNGLDLPECKGVVDVCRSANVSATDKKTGKTIQGYQPGAHGRDGLGLWADCVHPLAQGKAVNGVTGVSADAAKACDQAFRALNKPK